MGMTVEGILSMSSFALSLKRERNGTRSGSPLPASIQRRVSATGNDLSADDNFAQLIS